jgi:hypothetical protein
MRERDDFTEMVTSFDHLLLIDARSTQVLDACTRTAEFPVFLTTLLPTHGAPNSSGPHAVHLGGRDRNAT